MRLFLFVNRPIFYLLSAALLLNSLKSFSQDLFYIPRTSDEYIVLQQSENNYSITTCRINGEILSKQEFSKASHLTIRGFQQVSENEFYLDLKDKGIRMTLSEGAYRIQEEVQPQKASNGLLNHFYFSNDQKAVLFEITEANQAFASFFNRAGKILSRDQSSFNVTTNKFESEAWPGFIYKPQTNIITLNTFSNNIWFSLDLNHNKFTQHFYGRLADGKQGLLYRMYDRINELEFLLVVNEKECEVHQVPDFNRVIFLKGDQFLLGKAPKKPEFIIGQCAYLKKENSILLEKICF